MHITVCSGDGNDNGGIGTSIYRAIKTAVERGATVEVVSWKKNTSWSYRMLETEHGPKFRIRYLDEHWDAVCYSGRLCTHSQQMEVTDVSAPLRRRWQRPTRMRSTILVSTYFMSAPYG